MKKIEKMIKNVNEDEDKITVCFADDGLAVKGNVSKMQHVQGTLSMIASLIQRCGGDPKPVNMAVAALRNVEKKALKEIAAEDEEDEEDKEEKKDIKVAKFESLSDMLDYLKKEIDGKKD